MLAEIQMWMFAPWFLPAIALPFFASAFFLMRGVRVPALKLSIVGGAAITVVSGFILKTETGVYLVPGALFVLTAIWIRQAYVSRVNNFSAGAAFISVFATMLVADVIVGLSSGFRLYHVGGAGWLDGLIAGPVLSAIYIFIANRVVATRFQLS